MAEDTAPTPELTMRDVLQQVDRRLTRMEEDMRLQRTEILTRMEENVRLLRAEMQTGYDRLDNKIDGLGARMDSRFQWVLGIVLASWLSTMSTLLLK